MKKNVKKKKNSKMFFLFTFSSDMAQNPLLRFFGFPIFLPNISSISVLKKWAKYEKKCQKKKKFQNVFSFYFFLWHGSEPLVEIRGPKNIMIIALDHLYNVCLQIVVCSWMGNLMDKPMCQKLFLFVELLYFYFPLNILVKFWTS